METDEWALLVAFFALAASLYSARSAKRSADAAEAANRRPQPSVEVGISEPLRIFSPSDDPLMPPKIEEISGLFQTELTFRNNAGISLRLSNIRSGHFTRIANYDDLTENTGTGVTLLTPPMKAQLGRRIEINRTIPPTGNITRDGRYRIVSNKPLRPGSITASWAWADGLKE